MLSSVVDLVLAVVVTGLEVAALALFWFRESLKAAAVSQALMSSVLGSILALGLATEVGRWFSRRRGKRGAERWSVLAAGCAWRGVVFSCERAGGPTVRWPTLRWGVRSCAWAGC
jgi:hypothetical protein